MIVLFQIVELNLLPHSLHLAFLIDAPGVILFATEQGGDAVEPGVLGNKGDAQEDRHEGHFAFRTKESFFDLSVELSAHGGIRFLASLVNQVVDLVALALHTHSSFAAQHVANPVVLVSVVRAPTEGPHAGSFSIGSLGCFQELSEGLLFDSDQGRVTTQVLGPVGLSEFDPVQCGLLHRGRYRHGSGTEQPCAGALCGK